ncbi:hypothetical protein [Niabella hibiscisoli]|nr:hypothetical protein [Niabella hibiscisoli]
MKKYTMQVKMVAFIVSLMALTAGAQAQGNIDNDTKRSWQPSRR